MRSLGGESGGRTDRAKRKAGKGLQGVTAVHG
jgi:hypothetical protein